jgi:N-acetylglucosaminyldiphosphoundecaprenol N-acetyl-beta-D-mannosaminyltransferase
MKDKINSSILEIMGYNVFSGEPEMINYNNKLLVVDTLNAYSYVVARTDLSFKNALQHADVLLPDGFPVVLAARFLKGKIIKKIAGAEIFNFFCKRLDQSKGRCFFLGSTPVTLQRIAARIALDFPGIQVSSYSPAFAESFSEEENKNMLEAIRHFSPDVLFVGLTAPKQEKWVEQFRNEISAKIVCSIGAVFDFYAGTVKRPSKFWIRMNLEWFIRILHEPKRLWKRYLLYSPLFFIDMLKFKISYKNHR